MKKHSKTDRRRDKPPKRRLRYEPPRVVSEQQFETLALACGKTSPVIPGCLGAITS